MRTALTVLVLILTLSACASTDAATSDGASPDAPNDTPIPVEPDGGIGDGAGPPDSASSSIAEGEPIPIEGEGDIGDGQGAPAPLQSVPDFGVSSETDSDAVRPYASCWTPTPDGDGICEDGIPVSQRAFAASDQLVVTFEEGTLTAESSEAFGDGDPVPDRSPLPVEMENPGIWLIDVSGLGVGDHAIHLSWTGEQGDAAAIFDVSIQG